MASPFQRQAFHRKLSYAGSILVLFTLAFFWRSKEFRIAGLDVKGVEAQARALAIQEQSRGEVDPLAALVRLMTMGLRGVATCLEWHNAMEAQKRNQWNELEIHVGTLTKLQPHFITPWVFQSWNISYNVSVESDRVNDKYFWICRGINLLAKGDRQNHDNPDIRWSIGFFTQHKIGQSDETNALRSMFQLSTIAPNERDPGRFYRAGSGGTEIDDKELEAFCRKHPQLVRRLHDGMRRERTVDQRRQFRCNSADNFVQFLEDNYRVPSLYAVGPRPSGPGAWKEKQDNKLPLADRFPVLPPRHQARPKQQPPDPSALTDESELLDEHGANQAAHAWYSYAQEPLPKPGNMPAQSEPIEDRVHQRLPRHMMTVIFRDHPCMARRLTAERLQEEGWFDDEGWPVANWFSHNEEVRVGTKRRWGAVAWQQTREAWRQFGDANNLLLDEANERKYLKQANECGPIDGPTPQPPPADASPDRREQYFAWQFVKNYRLARTLTNFEFHYNRAVVETFPETLQARKTFFEANTRRLANDEIGALRVLLQPSGMSAWRDKVLQKNEVFRRNSFTQESTFEIQLRYLDLSARLGGDVFKAEAASMLLIPTAAPAGACPSALSLWMTPMFHPKGRLVFLDNPWDNPLLGGPFDRLDDKGKPLIDETARKSVLQRLLPAVYFPRQTPETLMKQGPPPNLQR